MEILKKIITRFGAILILFFACNFIYSNWFYQRDIQKYSKVRNAIDSAFQQGNVFYLGESSNTSFNPWTDTLNYSISDFIQMYLPNYKVKAITHESYHPGLFLKMLNLMPNYRLSKKKPTLIVTLNMRTCGPSAMHSENEASNQQEALFYSNRLPLLSRIFLSLHFYDNQNANERTRKKFREWRKSPLSITTNQNNAPTAKLWLDELALSNRPEVWKHMADAYVKEFAFLLTEQNQRIKDLDEIVKICNQKHVHLIFHLLPENREYAALLFGPELVNIMDYNAQFIRNHFKNKNLTLVDNYLISKGADYTDQWYPTEHFNTHIRHEIARNLAKSMGTHTVKLPVLEANNFPNWNIIQPMADTLLKNKGYGNTPQNEEYIPVFLN